MPALPRHILQDVYRAGDKTLFENSLYWRDEWVGLGPYRLTRWEAGSFIEAAAFDQYFMGRPKIDRVRINYVGDANALVANVLARAVDVVPSGAGLDPSDLVTVRDQWKSTGSEGLLDLSVKGIRTIYLQFRYPAAPWTQDARIRQALISALDRRVLAETLTEGVLSSTDFMVSQIDPVYKLAQDRRTPTYPFDPPRAQRLMMEAGWTRGPDGLFRNGAGEMFPRFDVSGNQGADNIREQAAIANMWANAGLQSEPKPFSALRGNELAEESKTFPGSLFRLWTLGPLALSRLVSTEVATAENRWIGSNHGSWVNPAYESLSLQLDTTLDRGTRRDLGFGLVKMLAEEVPVIPVYPATNPAIARQGVVGPGAISPEVPATMWNIYAWQYK